MSRGGELPTKAVMSLAAFSATPRLSPSAARRRRGVMEWAAALLSLAAVSLALPLGVARADTGEYLHFADEPSIEAQYPLGPDGVPQPRYPWGVEDNPVTVAQWALQNWSWWLRDHDQEHLDAALVAPTGWWPGRNPTVTCPTCSTSTGPASR
jgi:hypothetical protein